MSVSATGDMVSVLVDAWGCNECRRPPPSAYPWKCPSSSRPASAHRRPLVTWHSRAERRLPSAARTTV